MCSCCSTSLPRSGRSKQASSLSPLPYFKTVVPGVAGPPLRLAQRNSVASQNSPLPYFKTAVPGGVSPPPIPCAARFRRYSILAAPKLQDCGARRRRPTPGAAQFRRQSKFNAPILQGCSARRRRPSPTPGAAQFRRQSKFAAPILQDCSARRRQPSPTPSAASRAVPGSPGQSRAVLGSHEFVLELLNIRRGASKNSLSDTGGCANKPC